MQNIAAVVVLVPACYSKQWAYMNCDVRKLSQKLHVRYTQNCSTVEVLLEKHPFVVT